MASTEDLLAGLGAALRELRTERELSQEQLNMETGIHRNYIGGIERAERMPSVATVNALANALDVSMGELFRRAERGSG